MANDFSDEQYTFIFSNSDFVHFVSYFFSSYEDKIQNIGAELSQDDYDELLVYLRVILINLEEFVGFFHPLIKKVSYQYKKEEKVFNGQIRGKLLINHYVKEVSKRSIPKNYHCLIKTKSYSTPENVYIVFGLKEIVNRLKSFVKKINTISSKKDEKITELELISKYLKEIEGYLNKSYFSECEDIVKNIYHSNGHNFPKNERNLIERRIRLRKILNVDSYKKVIYWLDEFLEFDSLSFVDDNTLDMIRYGGDSFSDRLFELWCLYKIKETFKNDFGFESKDSHISFKKHPIFTLQNNEKTLKIYFQKGKGLYWDKNHEREWSYYREGSYRKLVGIPDITVVKENNGEESIIMIDIKNRIRYGGDNSEEIYKMIGYFSNFSKMIGQFNKSSNNHAILIFRNEESSFKEKITNQKGTNLLNVSVSLSDNPHLTDSQFRAVCNHILNNQKNIL